MAMSIMLQDERNNTLGRVDDAANLFVHLLPDGDDRSLMLRFIDPYGDTVFNGRQASVVVAELSWLAQGASGEELGIVDKVRELAVRCAREPHLYLRFEGD